MPACPILELNTNTSGLWRFPIALFVPAFQDHQDLPKERPRTTSRFISGVFCDVCFWRQIYAAFLFVLVMALKSNITDDHSKREMRCLFFLPSFFSNNWNG